MTADHQVEMLSPAFQEAVAHQRLLGIDYGKRRIGLALSDISGRVAAPFGHIAGRKFSLDARELLTIAKKQGVAGLVIGLPLDQDGRVGPSAQRARTFGFNLVRLAGCRLPIGYWDERFSTQAVERMLISEGDVSRANRAKKIDQLSATYILQGALDYLNQTRKTG